MIIPIEWLKQYVKINKSPKEIADSFTLLGLMLEKPIENEVMDLEHRMDRADWLSIIGCARDLAAYENLDLIYPETYEGEYEKVDKPEINIEVKSPEALNRFNTLVIKGVEVKESPDWIKNRLENYGIPSINNIVDITNYVMVEMGQPLHAQDISKLNKPEIVIRESKEGETIETLLGETIKLLPKTYVLTQNDTPTVILGVVGGKATCVDNNTTDIVLDAGNYNQNAIRKSSRKLKIQNETVARCDKFLHPKLTEVGLRRAVKLILELAGGTVYENKDWYPNPITKKIMSLRYSRIKKIGGIDFEKERVRNILEKLEYKIIEDNGEEVKLEVPYFRTDVIVEDDIVSDILRINGYDKIPVTALNETPPQEITPDIYKFEETLRDICIRMGLHEHITEPLLSESNVVGNKVTLENAMSAELNTLRTDIYQTLYPVTRIYEKHGIKKTEIFEIGLEYIKSNNEYIEKRKLGIISFDKNKSPIENVKEVKVLLATLLQELGIAQYTIKDKMILVENTTVGRIEPDYINLSTKALMDAKKTQYKLRIKSEFSVERSGDISLTMDIKNNLGEVIDTIKNIDPMNIFNVWVIEQIPDESKLNKNVLLRIEYDYPGSFEDLKVKIVKELENKHGIKSRS